MGRVAEGGVFPGRRPACRAVWVAGLAAGILACTGARPDPGPDLDGAPKSPEVLEGDPVPVRDTRPPGDDAALEALGESLDADPTGAEAGYALLFPDAVVYARPDPDAALGHIGDPPAGGRAGPDVRLYVVRVLSTAQAGFVRIETMTGRETVDHCFGLRHGISHRYQVRAYVRRTDLAPLVRGPFSRRYADGTGLSLSAGSPVRTTTDGLRVRLYDAGLEVPLDLVDPLDEVFSRIYEAPGGAGSVEHLDVRLNPAATWHLAESPFVGHGDDWENGRLVSLIPHPDGESGTLATLGGPCWTLTLRTDDDAASRPRPQAYGVGGLGTRVEGPRITEGTEAFWPDGSPAGKARHDFVVTDSVEAVDDLRCIPWEGEVRICHRAQDLD